MSVHNNQMLLLKGITEVRGGNNFTSHSHLCQKKFFFLVRCLGYFFNKTIYTLHTVTLKNRQEAVTCAERDWGPGVGDCALSAFLCSSFSLLRVILFYESNRGLSSEWNYGAFVFSSYFPKNHIKEESKNLTEY